MAVAGLAAVGLATAGLATTGLAAAGLAATGLAATGLAVTGLVATGLAATGLDVGGAVTGRGVNEVDLRTGAEANDEKRGTSTSLLFSVGAAVGRTRAGDAAGAARGVKEVDRRKGVAANEEKRGTSTSLLFSGASFRAEVPNLNSLTAVGAARVMRGTPKSPADSITRLLSGRALKERW